MLTIENYFSRVKNIDPGQLPGKLQEGFDFVRELTDEHTQWDYYHADAEMRAVVDQYFARLSAHLDGKPPAAKSAAAGAGNHLERQAREVAKKAIRTDASRGLQVGYFKKAVMGAANGSESVKVQGGKIKVDMVAGQKVDFTFPVQSIYNEVMEELNSSKPAAAQPPRIRKPAEKRKRTASADPAPTTSPRRTTGTAAPVERIDDAVRFIKRYALLHGKTRTDAQILNFLNSLQKAILEKRIRKTSPHAAHIEYIQKNLVKLHNEMGRSVEIRVQDAVLAKFLAIAGSQAVRMSVAYMKRYIGMQGKHIDKEKAAHLHKLVTTALDNEKIGKSDPYREKIFRVLSSLKAFINKARPADTLQLHSTVLNGIRETLDGCCLSCDDRKEKRGLDGLQDETMGADADDTVLNSVDFADMKFETLGFMGRWKDFIGDPVAGFTAMVTGRPKTGKSYLCADFAGYLARHHGETLFVAGEEKLGATLQQKIDAVKHPCLHVSGKLPDDLTPYEFIVLDSVNRLKLQPSHLQALKAAYPEKAFIGVYQVTKAGKFRGSNEAQHDVDIVIEVPEKGRAVQFGRFNQGGEMSIFADEPPALAA